jgi:hypothetical protein
MNYGMSVCHLCALAKPNECITCLSYLRSCNWTVMFKSFLLLANELLLICRICVRTCKLTAAHMSHLCSCQGRMNALHICLILALTNSERMQCLPPNLSFARQSMSCLHNQLSTELASLIRVSHRWTPIACKCEYRWCLLSTICFHISNIQVNHHIQ